MCIRDRDYIMQGNNKLDSNIITLENIEKFQVFNDFVTIFKNLGNKILIFGDVEDNENLITLLISTVLRKTPTLKLMDALQFVKNLKSGDGLQLREEKIFWCSPLINYHEFVRKNKMYWGPSSNKTINTTSMLSYQNINSNPMFMKTNKRHEDNMMTNLPKQISVSSSKRSRAD